MPTCSTFRNWSHLYTVKVGLPSYCTIGCHIRRWFSLSNSDLSTNIRPDLSSLGLYAVPSCSTFGNWSHLYTLKFGLPSYCTIGWHLRRWFFLSNSDCSTSIWPDFSSLGPYAVPTCSTFGNWSHLYTVKFGLLSYSTIGWHLRRWFSLSNSD